MEYDRFGYYKHDAGLQMTDAEFEAELAALKANPYRWEEEGWHFADADDVPGQFIMFVEKLLADRKAQ